MNISSMNCEKVCKSTVLKHVFPHPKYKSLEDLELNLLVSSDTRVFFEKYRDGGIIDEAQKWIPICFFYRDSEGFEVDLMEMKEDGSVEMAEIKSGKTFKPQFLTMMKKLKILDTKHPTEIWRQWKCCLKGLQCDKLEAYAWIQGRSK